MKISIVTTIVSLSLQQVHGNVNSLSLSRNALLTSVRRASPSTHQKPSFLPPIEDDLFDSEDPFAEDSHGEVQLCSVRC